MVHGKCLMSFRIRWNVNENMYIIQYKEDKQECILNAVAVLRSCSDVQGYLIRQKCRGLKADLDSDLFLHCCPTCVTYFSSLLGLHEATFIFSSEWRTRPWPVNSEFLLLFFLLFLRIIGFVDVTNWFCYRYEYFRNMYNIYLFFLSLISLFRHKNMFGIK